MAFKDRLKKFGFNSSDKMTSNSKILAEIALIIPYFDVEFYKINYPDYVHFNEDPLEHFIIYGWKLLYDPNPNFSTKYYIKTYTDVKEAGINPFVHFIKFGKKENRKTSEEHELVEGEYNEINLHSTCRAIENHFDFEHYRKCYMIGDISDQECLVHFVEKGVFKGFDPTPTFSTNYYLFNNPDVAKLNLNPFYHYIIHGKAEGREASQNQAIVASLVQDIDEETINVLLQEIDLKFYASKYKLEVYSELEAVVHYIKKGVELNFDPNSEFSTQHYLIANPDIKQSGLNPFYHYLKHGKAEGRSCVNFLHPSKLKGYLPKITAIVPNYNHEKFLEERINSILNQSYENIEILVLDDCSKDNSRAVINKFAEKYPGKIRTLFNEENSGGVFNQWQKGLFDAEGELIWICESDDSVTPNFIDSLYRYFLDPSVMIAFGRIQFMNSEGIFMEGLDGYREGAWKGIWDKEIIKPAKAWFDGPFGIRNVIPNVGGCIFRKQEVSQEDWQEVKKYKILGDWHLYSILASGGKIVYDPNAISYFRQHQNNTSVKSFVTDNYYKEHHRLIEHLIERWGITTPIIDKFVSYTKWQYLYHFGQDKQIEFSKIFDVNKLYSISRNKKHVMIGFLGFHIGGGEIFPINLANALIDQGYIVSMLAIDLCKNVKEIYDLLDSRISVYSMDYVNELGHTKFFYETGVDLVNTHNVGLEFNLVLTDNYSDRIKYLVTLHGSYEVTDISSSQLDLLSDRVDHWLYTADKNLKPIKGVYDEYNITKTRNGMKIGNTPFEVSRADLKIGSSDFVYGFMARGIKSKGWEQAIKSFLSLNDNKAHLLMVGTGEEKDRMEEIYGDNPNIRFLGFKSNVYGFFGLCDCCILPTRFKGESYPLVLIQSMQVGVPIVSVDIGEISSMLNQLNRKGGICIPHTDNDAKFENDFFNAMKKIKDDKKSYKKYRSGAKKIGTLYSISKVAEKYKNIYEKSLSK